MKQWLQIPIQRLEMMLIWNPKIAKVEFGNNFAINSNGLENSDPFYVFFATSLCIGVRDLRR
jgi:hypothetical protein